MDTKAHPQTQEKEDINAHTMKTGFMIRIWLQIIEILKLCDLKTF